MTISTTANRASAAGNGSTTAFSFPYLFFADADLKVILVVDSTGVETVKTISTHYTVAGAGVAAGGTVTMGSAPASGETLVIIREEQFTQGLDLVENDPFPSDLVEKQFDILTMLSQQLSDTAGRTVKLSDGDTSGANTTLAAPVADAFLKWDAAGTALTSSSTSAGQTLGGNGTVSLPYYSFTSDPNTGWYRIGADNVGLSLGGVKIADYAAAKTIFASTVEAGADTSAGDNAAMGYTAAEGLVLTGQGSTNDVTIKNDADAIVAKIATGTTNLDVIGNISGTDLTLSGDLTVNGSTISLQVTNQVTADPLIEINNGAGSNANDLGVIMERGSTGNNIFVGWDESADEFVAATTTGTGSSTGNLSLAAYANAQFANVSMGQLTATSGTLAGITSLAMSAGATLTAGFLSNLSKPTSMRRSRPLAFR